MHIIHSYNLSNTYVVCLPISSVNIYHFLAEHTQISAKQTHDAMSVNGDNKVGQ